MTDRRNFLTHSLLTAGAIGATSSIVPAKLFAAAKPGSKPPTRFIFLHKGNGLLPQTLVPPTWNEKQKEAERKKEAYTVDLDGHELPQ
ncbi:MAG: hypothetical protein AAF483_28695, partial [Planctomycetota bacterium]